MTTQDEYVKAFSKIGELVGILVVSWAGELPSEPVTVEAAQSEDTLNRKEAALLLKVTANTVANLEKEGKIRRIPNLGPRTVRYSRADLIKFKHQRKRE